MGAEDVLQDRWYLTACATAFSSGDRKMFARTADGDSILPIMREAMQIIIDEGVSPFIDRAKALRDDLSGSLAFGLEPSDAEFNPEPSPKKEYRISVGDTVWIGAQEFEVVFLDYDKAVLSDTKFPMLQEEYSRLDFDRFISENPMNDRYLQIVERPRIETYTPLDANGRFTIREMSYPDFYFHIFVLLRLQLEKINYEQNY